MLSIGADLHLMEQNNFNLAKTRSSVARMCREYLST